MIRPSITRRELTELKRLHKSPSSTPHVDMTKLIERRRRLLAELLEIRRQIKDANSRI